MGENGFDSVVIDMEGDWPRRDRAAFVRVRCTVRQADDTPQLVVVMPMSSHYGYCYPPKYESNGSAVPAGRQKRDGLQARYLKSLRFLDDEICGLIDELDTANNIFVITGDHGESFGEDGAMFHTSLLSEVQTRVPLIMIGPNIPSRSLHDLSSHLDMLPTLLHAIEGQPVPIKNCCGRDHLARHGPNVEHLLMVNPLSDSQDLMLLASEGRLIVNVRDEPFDLRVRGFAGDDGRIDPRRSRSRYEIPVWAARLARAIDDVVNPTTPAPNSWRGSSGPHDTENVITGEGTCHSQLVRQVS